MGAAPEGAEEARSVVARYFALIDYAAALALWSVNGQKLRTPRGPGR